MHTKKQDRRNNPVNPVYSVKKADFWIQTSELHPFFGSAEQFGGGAISFY